MERVDGLFSGGVGGIKFEFWWGVSSFSGRVGGIKFKFWWRGLIVRIGRYI